MTVEIKQLNEDEFKQMLLEHEIKARLSGFHSGEEMDNFKVDASLGMIKFGGGFTHHLGHALAHADSTNTMKIIRQFKDMCEHHAALYKKSQSDRFRDGVKDGEKLFDLGETNNGT